MPHLSKHYLQPFFVFSHSATSCSAFGSSSLERTPVRQEHYNGPDYFPSGGRAESYMPVGSTTERLQQQQQPRTQPQSSGGGGGGGGGYLDTNSVTVSFLRCRKRIFGKYRGGLNNQLLPLTLTVKKLRLAAGRWRY
jgi:hypothetical protein